MGATSIEWTDKTWNPVRGCTRVSPGCEHCYAETIAARFSGPGQPYEGLATRSPPRWTRKVRLVPEHLADPLRWRKPRRIFVNSMSDLFHEGLTDEEIAAVFGVMAACPQHTFQVLTKRPARMRAWFEWIKTRDRIYPAQAAISAALRHPNVCQGGGLVGNTDQWIKRWVGRGMVCGWPLPNVWIGVSVEDQQRADERIPLLLDTPATVRFLSCEPLLSRVTLNPWLLSEHGRRHIGAAPGISWVIVGGESGPGARPCDIEALESIVAQCKAAGVPVFVKQLGGAASDPRNGLAGAGLKVNPDAIGLLSRRLKDRAGGNPAEWPEHLRVREFPEVRR